MSATTIEWLVVGIFFVCLFAISLAEGGWLSRFNQIPFGKAFAYAFATNTFAITIGFFVSFVIMAVIMMLAFGGSLQGLSDYDWRLLTAVIVAFLFPILLLTLAKRLALRIFKMHSVASPWLYSSAASVVFLVLVIAIPTAFVYVVPFSGGKGVPPKVETPAAPQV